jgi:hypothetical protein
MVLNQFVDTAFKLNLVGRARDLAVWATYIDSGTGVDS